MNQYLLNTEGNFLYPKGRMIVKTKYNEHNRNTETNYSWEWNYHPWKKCEYCGITELEYLLLRTKKDGVDCMTRDHIDPNIKTLNNNCVLACFRCNGTKNHTLSYEDMKEIGPKYIRPIWEMIRDTKLEKGELNKLPF